MKSIVSIHRCPTYHIDDVQQAVERCLTDIGGIESIVKKHNRVLIKPNLLSASEPFLAITTHPEFIRAVVRIVHRVGAKAIIGDSCYGSVRMEEVYEKTGVKRICEQENAECIFFNKVTDWKIPLASIALESDVIINLPKFKTHNLTILTGGIKNMFGIVPGTQKINYHSDYPSIQEFSKLLIDILEKVKPHLTIMDGIIGLEGDGPGSAGKARNIGLILCSRDVVALDTVMAVMMGLDPLHIPMLRIADVRGIGNCKMEDIEIDGESTFAKPIPGFILPKSGIILKIPSATLKLVGRFISIMPVFKKQVCSKCGLCVKSCPKGAIVFKKNFLSLDVHRCISCLCCQEICPRGAVKAKICFRFK